MKDETRMISQVKSYKHAHAYTHTQARLRVYTPIKNNRSKIIKTKKYITCTDERSET